jgi:hypothetical protein
MEKFLLISVLVSYILSMYHAFGVGVTYIFGSYDSKEYEHMMNYQRTGLIVSVLMYLFFAITYFIFF